MIETRYVMLTENPFVNPDGSLPTTPEGHVGLARRLLRLSGDHPEYQHAANLARAAQTHVWLALVTEDLDLDAEALARLDGFAAGEPVPAITGARLAVPEVVRSQIEHVLGTVTPGGTAHRGPAGEPAEQAIYEWRGAADSPRSAYLCGWDACMAAIRAGLTYAGVLALPAEPDDEDDTGDEDDVRAGVPG
jgi:hypothetical protein